MLTISPRGWTSRLGRRRRAFTRKDEEKPHPHPHPHPYPYSEHYHVDKHARRDPASCNQDPATRCSQITSVPVVPPWFWVPTGAAWYERHGRSLLIPAVDLPQCKSRVRLLLYNRGEISGTMIICVCDTSLDERGNRSIMGARGLASRNSSGYSRSR